MRKSVGEVSGDKGVDGNLKLRSIVVFFGKLENT